MRRPRTRPLRRRARPHRSPALLLAVAAGLAIGACGCGQDTAAPPTSSSTTEGTTAPPRTDPAPTSTTTAAPTDDEAEVRATIDRYWDAWFAATANPPDPDNPDLNAVLVGDAKERIVGGVERRLNEGHFVRLPPNSVFRRSTEAVTFRDDGVAVAEECVIDDSELADMASNELVEGGLATVRLTLTLVKYPDGWKITTSTTVDNQDGVAQCDA